jgi:DNA polymerase
MSPDSSAVKRPKAGSPSYVQSAANPSGAGTPAMRGVTGSGVEDGPPLAQVPDLDDADRVVALTQLAQEVSQCTRCPDLVRNRTQTVFGYGAPRTRLVLMGEAPGAEEDRMGEPMVGASGQLLDKIIAAMKLRREEVYILNAVKCQPPKNRNPLDVECGNCRPFWVRQLEIIRPEVIVCLGAVASKTLLQTTQPVGRLRGSVHAYRGAKVIVTYHPSYLLRTESKKRETWDDMKVVMDLLGIPR